MKAGSSSGDLTFPIPFCPEFHFPEFSSAVADMKNSVAVSYLWIKFYPFNLTILKLERIGAMHWPLVQVCSYLHILDSTTQEFGCTSTWRLLFIVAREPRDTASVCSSRSLESIAVASTSKALLRACRTMKRCSMETNECVLTDVVID